MKLLKNKKINNKFSIIILMSMIVLILVPIIFEIMGYKENMSDYINFSDYNTIDRIEGDVAGTHMYCIGGNANCTTLKGNLVKGDQGSYKLGTTYKSTCDDDSDVLCTDNLFSGVVSYNLSNYTLDPSGVTFPLSKSNKGFTTPYSYDPAYFDDKDNIVVTDACGNILNTSHKCNFLSLDNQFPCYKKFFTGYGSSASTSSTVVSTSSSTNNNSVDSSAISDGGKCGDKEKIPCVADFGTNVGDNLCCGQSGVLQNTKYVCPITRPKCSNFKCGAKFGNCE